MRSLKGQLLLDGGKLAGSEFHRTVVLICEHNAEGAFGLVLNRPTTTPVGDALTELLPAFEKLPLFVGGPVENRFLSLLVHDPAAAEAILPGLRMGHNLDDLQHASPEQVKFFAGYAGWAPGQLDAELERDAWLIHPASLDLVFDPDPVTLWKRILRGKGPAYQLLAEAPDNLLWN